MCSREKRGALVSRRAIKTLFIACALDVRGDRGDRKFKNRKSKKSKFAKSKKIAKTQKLP
jgi:hypothetical protein